MSSSILFPTNEYTTANKSSQEIQKLMMPEQSPVQILRLILTKGHSLQQPYAYSNFYMYPVELLDVVCGRLPRETPQNQILIVESLKKLKNVNLQHKQISLFFQSLIEALKNWSTINNQHLAEAIQVLIEMANDKSDLLKGLQKTILQMGRQSEPIISRVTAGRLIPVLSKNTSRSIKGEMIDIIKRIIGDAEIQAKKVWVVQIFPKLLENLKQQFIQLHLQQKIYQTVYDQNQEIGLMALEVILRNVTKFSIQEQSSRIVKLFIDSMTSKNQKIALMTTSFMGQTFQKLQSIILKSQNLCLRFWKSLIEVAESNNQKIVNNFIFNLPGILMLSKKYHRVDPVCDVYTQLFYNTDSDILLLASYFHQMVKMFPLKLQTLKTTAYNLFNQIFQENQSSDESMKIIDSILLNLYDSKQVFFDDQTKQKQKFQGCEDLLLHMKLNDQVKGVYFQSTFNQYLFKYLNLCLNKKNGNCIKNLYNSISKCIQYFPPNFTQISLLPKLYSAIRSKGAFTLDLIKIIIAFLVRDCSSNCLINNYVSKINVELSKSAKSHQREAAMMFFYYSSFEFSADTFQQFKMGEKFLQFNNEKSLKNKLNFINFCPRLNYFFTRQEKIQYTIILSRIRKDVDPQIIRTIENTDFNQYDHIKDEILAKSKQIKEKEKSRGTLAKKSILLNRKEPIKQLKKQEVLKKRVETRSRTKMLIKQVSKKKTPMSMTRPILRKNS